MHSWTPDICAQEQMTMCTYAHVFSITLIWGSNNTCKRETGLAPQKDKRPKAPQLPTQVRFHNVLLARDLASCPPPPGKTGKEGVPAPHESPRDRPARESTFPSAGEEGRNGVFAGSIAQAQGGWWGGVERRGAGPANRGTRRRSRGADRSRGPTRSHRPRPEPRSSPARRRWAGWG